MRIVCPQSTLDVLREPSTGPAPAPIAVPTTHPLTPRRAAPPIPHDRHPQPTTRARANAHPYANTRARTAAANAAAQINTPEHNIKNNANNNANTNNATNNTTKAPPPAPRRVPRMTNSARQALHYNALHREPSARRMSMRQRTRDTKMEKVDAARKKENLKKGGAMGNTNAMNEIGNGNGNAMGKQKEARRRRKMGSSSVKEYKYVYVGNLPTSITEARIQEFFTSNGVRDLDGLPSIRTTGGTVGAVVIPSELRTEKDRRYACIRFKSNASVYRALKLNQTLFEGMELVITIDPTNLPECHQILSSHMEEIAELKKMQANLKGRLMSGQGPSPLQLQDTERVITTMLQQNAAGRFKVFGVSFAPCIS